MVPNESNFIIISGPNAAGKSTLLKTVGISVYLSHIGCFVPCYQAEIPIFHSIHARIGAWDSIRMSTFTVEMTEMSSILQTANSTSLILIDELGRSTSCSDGFGLAWAISKEIGEKIGGFTLFATHFHELCNLENEMKGVVNYHMEAAHNDSTLRMCYTFKKGIFPNSFGIVAAERSGFPESVVRRSKEKLLELQLADGESVDIVRAKINADPNVPYLRFLDEMRHVNLETFSPTDLVRFVESKLGELDKSIQV